MAVFLIACGNNEEEISVVQDSGTEVIITAEDSGKNLAVLATTPMLGEFVKKVAGENIEVQVLMPYTVDPHHFEPSPQDVKKINEADLVFYVGLQYETASLRKLLENSVESGQVLIEIGSKVNPIEFGNDDHDDHGKHDDHDDKDKHDDEDKHDDHDDKDKHDDEDKHDDHDDKDKHDDEDKHDDHDHGVFDPHFWFDPNRVALAVGAIKNELINIDPENKNDYESSANNYLDKLKALDDQISTLIETIPSDDRKIITTHESLGYLENRYGVEVLVTIIPSVTTEDAVTPKQLVNVIEEVKEHEIKVLFLESESPTKSAEIIAAETNIKLVSGLWVETLKINQSYIDFLKTNVDLIVENLKD